MAWPLQVLPALPGCHPAAQLSLVLSPLPSCPDVLLCQLLCRSHSPPPECWRSQVCLTAGLPALRVPPAGRSPPRWGFRHTCPARMSGLRLIGLSHGTWNPTHSTLGSPLWAPQAGSPSVGPPAPSHPTSRPGVTLDFPSSPPTNPSPRYPPTCPPLSSSLSRPPKPPHPQFHQESAGFSIGPDLSKLLCTLGNLTHKSTHVAKNLPISSSSRITSKFLAGPSSDFPGPGHSESPQPLPL